jgi:hypothetical protein
MDVFNTVLGKGAERVLIVAVLQSKASGSEFTWIEFNMVMLSVERLGLVRTIESAIDDQPLSALALRMRKGRGGMGKRWSLV